MVTAQLYPGSKSENIVYIAFGFTFGLFLIRLTSPSIFDEIDSAITIALLAGSLISSLLFYLKPERSVNFVLRWAIIRKHGSTMRKFLISSDLGIESWRVAPTQEWENPDSRMSFFIRRLIEGPDLYDDIWILKSFPYFCFGAFFLLFSIGWNLYLIFILSGLAIIIAIVSLWVSYSDFRLRCTRIALFRNLQAEYSVFNARDNNERPYGTPFIGTSSSEKKLEPVLEELQTLLEKHDWIGFEKRFQYLVEDLNHYVSLISADFVRYFVNDWSWSLYWSGNTREDTSLTRILVLQKILQSGIKHEVIKILKLSLMLSQRQV